MLWIYIKTSIQTYSYTFSTHTCEFLNSENNVNSTCKAWILLLCTGMSRIPVNKSAQKTVKIIIKLTIILWATQCNSDNIIIARNGQISDISEVVATYHKSNPHIDSTPHPDPLLEAQPFNNWKHVCKLEYKVLSHTASYTYAV